MEVIVNDTNILIDLANTGLMPFCQQMDIQFVTTDMVVSELHNSKQAEHVERMKASGALSVESMEGENLMNVILTYQSLSATTNLTPADVSVILLAEKHSCRLLTNDQKLHRQAEKRGVQVNGLLWLTDRMVEDNILTPLQMVDHLHKLLTTNERAPRKLIMERIKLLTNKM